VKTWFQAFVLSNATCTATLWEKRQVIEAAIEELEERAAAAQKSAAAAASAAKTAKQKAALEALGDENDQDDDELDAFMDQIGARKDEVGLCTISRMQLTPIA
jgi:hypothetical protein